MVYEKQKLSQPQSKEKIESVLTWLALTAHWLRPLSFTLPNPPGPRTALAS